MRRHSWESSVAPKGSCTSGVRRPCGQLTHLGRQHCAGVKQCSGSDGSPPPNTLHRASLKVFPLSLLLLLLLLHLYNVYVCPQSPSVYVWLAAVAAAIVGAELQSFSRTGALKHGKYCKYRQTEALFTC